MWENKLLHVPSASPWVIDVLTAGQPRCTLFAEAVADAKSCNCIHTEGECGIERTITQTLWRECDLVAAAYIVRCMHLLYCKVLWKAGCPPNSLEDGVDTRTGRSSTGLQTDRQAKCTPKA